MLGESLLTLAALAGQMVVDAAASDEWEPAERGYAELLGRGNAKQAKRWLEETREQLSGLDGAGTEMVRMALAGRWAGRWADLLEENPDTEDELRALVEQSPAARPGDQPSAPDPAASLAGDMSSYAAGPEHPGALATRSELAYAAGQAGDAVAARDQFAALLPVAERILGPEHPDTLTTRHNLANFTGYAGDAGAARDQFTGLLSVRERVFGADSPDTIVARFNLAYWTGRAGDAVAARDQFAALLPVRERMYGPDHPDTLAVQEELAYWTGCAGDAAAARDQFAALLSAYEEVLGPEHPETLAVWYQLAHWTALGGDEAASTG
jgi:tetratricopeptide repeat protein